MMNDNQEDLGISEETIIIDWSTSQQGMRQVSRSQALEKMRAQSERAINIAMGNIRTMASRVAETMERLEDKSRPAEAEVEFGLNLDADLGAFLAKASGGAQINVKLKWYIEQPQHQKIITSE
jgi:hypothetical protein